MPDVSLTLLAHGRADLDQAWDRYATLARWPQWSPQIRRVEADGSRLRPGLTGQVIGPVGIAAGFVIDDVNESARSWSWHVRRGPIRVRMHHVVQAHPDGVATALRLTGPAPIVLGYAPLALLALTRLVRP